MSEALYLGIDVGSTTVKIVAVDQDMNLLAWRYARSQGRPRPTILENAQSVAEELGMTLDELADQATAVGFTGSGGRPVSEVLGGRHVNELVAQVRAIGEYAPEARTIVEIGGQDSKFMSVKWDDTLGRMVLIDMALNNLCAAGTGAFLDQQAERLEINIEEEFADIAMKSENPARIAGRCTVFAKSDMIHLQQKGTPLEDILAGLSMALARNFKSVIGKGKRFTPPIVIQGGIAYNDAVVRAFSEVLKVKQEDLIIPEYHHLMPALGTAFVAMDDPDRCQGFRGFGALDPKSNTFQAELNSMPQLHRDGIAFADRDPDMLDMNDISDGELIPVYLGVDVGSITTKVVAIDEEGTVVARRYVPTRGRPLEVVQDSLLEVGAEIEGRVHVLGVGATGSGRHLTADFVGGDVVRSEITAQARAAIAIDPQVDTVFEIGGQDSKFIRLEDGAVVNFSMNNACAAGTGSFLEEQADRLEIEIEDEFSQKAFCAECPAALGERCTVFMESDLVHHQQQGAQITDLTAGLSYAIAENYLNRVVGNRAIGKHIFFQGGVAWNDSVVSAFKNLMKRPITVPPHHDVTGAIGVALLARDEMTQKRMNGEEAVTGFQGFDLRNRTYETRSFICKKCPNLCEINRVVIGDEAPIFYGARCDIYDTPRHGAISPDEIPDLFAERQALLMGDYVDPGERGNRKRVGMPRTLQFYDMFPYWRTFFEELDLDLVLSSETNPKISRYTRELAVAEICYPAKLAYGHVHELLDKDVDLIFMPAIINRENPSPGQEENTYCVFIRAAGDMVRAGMNTNGIPIVSTPIHIQWDKVKQRDLKRMAKELGVPYKRIFKAEQAAQKAQADFYAAILQRGEEALTKYSDKYPAIVLVGRPYNTADSGVSQNLPYELRKLGALPIPMDYLPIKNVDISDSYSNMFWRSGQDILSAGKLIRDDERLYCTYVSSFNCGPDSFILSFFRRMMAGKPFLELEVDEHSGEAGIVTRVEAFLESLQTRQQMLSEASAGGSNGRNGEGSSIASDIVWTPSPIKLEPQNGNGGNNSNGNNGSNGKVKHGQNLHGIGLQQGDMSNGNES